MFAHQHFPNRRNFHDFCEFFWRVLPREFAFLFRHPICPLPTPIFGEKMMFSPAFSFVADNSQIIIERPHPLKQFRS
jgi:hypothetical protein